MNNIINNTAFVGRYQVANFDDPTVSVELDYLIATYQEEYLRTLLGPDIYSLFATWYNSEEPRPENAEFEFLLTGGNFVSREGVPLYAPPISQAITAYVYCKWQEWNYTQTVSMGEVKTESQNALISSARLKVIDAWNFLVNASLTYWAYLHKQYANNATWTTWERMAREHYVQDIYIKRNRLDI